MRSEATKSRRAGADFGFRIENQVNIMIRFDKLLFSVLFGIAIPILCFIVFWWGTFLFTNNQQTIKIAALSGLGVGILISLLIKFIRKPDIYSVSIPVLILVYLFYNGILFTMFMGIPVFHPVMGVIAGYYWAKYILHHKEITDYGKEILRISVFASVVIGIVCICSAVVALVSKSTAEELKIMFNLSFNISQPLLVTFIIAGGLLLVIIQYLLVKITMKTTLSGDI